MTTRNKDLFYRDPTQTKIPNDGVAKVAQPETDQQWKVLEWELGSFVCEGEYERGLERILDSYLTNLGQSQQPAVWVSGFYGSGKSHLCRVLEYLWRDVQLPSGERARSLVNLPSDIEAHLTELSIAGRRLGGVWSAAGTLGAGVSQAVRLAFLSVLFTSAGLPAQYPLARFTIWAQDNGYLDSVEAAVAAAGKEYDHEVRDLYVSPIIARALHEVDSTLGDSVKEVRSLLKEQFPARTEDLTAEEMFEAIEDVLRLKSTTPGRYPLTLILLDEMQQYLGDDNERTLAVQNIVEGVSARFDNSVLFVATGQSAMGGTPTLQKLTDRFPVQVHLSDKDVETVVRQVILRKKPDRRSELQSVLDEVSGEIDRHLGGTKIAPMAADRQDLVADYPLLPTRRRFWELALRALDRAGKAGVLRTQLRIIHEATREVADSAVGHVVGADFIYDQQAPALQQSGVLLKEIDELIRSIREEGSDGELKSRICALIFLISHLPSQVVGGGELGLSPTAAFLADLLVEDLKGGGGQMRARVPDLLEELVAAGRLMRIDDEYRLQTEAGAEWEQEYRTYLKAIRDDPSRLATLRNERLDRAIDEALAGLKLTQGESRTPRRIILHVGSDDPPEDGAEVPVWVRDEWTVADATVQRSAAQAGDESPVIHVLIPKRDAEGIKDTLASHAAAQATVQSQPTPHTDEGREAQRAMRGRITNTEEKLAGQFRQVVASARVYQGGGTLVDAADVRTAVDTAARRSLVRLFPNFTVADNPNWDKVTRSARDGAPDPLQAVGHAGDAPTHPVCKEVLATISASGTKGTDLNKRFSSPPYGWPQDAIRGTVMALLATRHIRAAQDGLSLHGPKELEPRQIAKTTFYKEDEPPTTTQRFAMRGLLTAADIDHEPGQEEDKVAALLQKLVDLAKACGGAPPLPDPPDTSHIATLQTLAGNQQFRAVADAHGQLKQDLQTWTNASDRREARQAEWSELGRYLSHADDLAVAAETRAQYNAIKSDRQLLDEPDPVVPLVGELTDALRAELSDRAERLSAAREQAIVTLNEDELWQQLTAQDQQDILQEVGLSSWDAPDVSSDERLLRVLDESPLTWWDDRIQFVDARIDHARQIAAKRQEPASVPVKVPSRAIRTPAELDAYVDEIRALVTPHLDNNTTVIL